MLIGTDSRGRIVASSLDDDIAKRASEEQRMRLANETQLVED